MRRWALSTALMRRRPGRARVVAGRGCGTPPHSWSNAEFDALRKTENTSSDASFAACERGWTEQRLQLWRGVNALEGTAIGRRVAAALAALTPAAPSLRGFRPVPRSRWNGTVALGGVFEVGLDAAGAVTTLVDTATGRGYASPSRRLVSAWWVATARRAAAALPCGKEQEQEQEQKGGGSVCVGGGGVAS